jgi:hypothetical protein
MQKPKKERKKYYRINFIFVDMQAIEVLSKRDCCCLPEGVSKTIKFKWSTVLLELASQSTHTLISFAPIMVDSRMLDHF